MSEAGSPTEGSDLGCFPNSAPRSGALISSVLDTEISHQQDQLQSEQFVRFGDSIKLYVTSIFAKNESKDRVVGPGLSGYLGVYEKPDKTTRLAVPPIGEQAEGTFVESVLRVQDPLGRVPDGTEVRYGDVLVLVDKNGLVWNNKASGGTFASFFEGYLSPRPRGTPGEMYVSFQKNMHERRPVIYGDHGVYVDVANSHRTRTTHNYRLTNYRSPNSSVKGGYVCSDGTGYDLPFCIHRHTGPPVQAYRTPVLGRHPSRRNSSISQGDSSRALGSLFVPPRIKQVAVRRKSGALDVMMKDPLYGKPIKLYMLRPDDAIEIELDQRHAVAKIGADHLFSIAESAAASQSSGPIQLDIAVDKSGAESDAGAAAAAAAKPHESRKVDLTSVELLIEQDIVVLKRAFQDDRATMLSDPFQDLDAPGSAGSALSSSVGSRTAKMGKLDLLIASHKLALVYCACAIVLPYFLWQCLLVVGDLVEPVHQLSRTNKSLALIERLATTLLEDFGIPVVDGRAVIEEAHRNMETTTITSSLFAFVVCYAMGLITPDFAREGSLSSSGSGAAASGKGDGESEAANWLISVQVPENWDPSAASAAMDRAMAAARAAEDGELTEDEDDSDAAAEAAGKAHLKVNGVVLGGTWGSMGVDDQGVPRHPAFERFLAGEKGNMEAAKERWVRTCTWRTEGDIDNILSQPHPTFHIIKKNLPQFYCGRSKQGYPIYIECPGNVKLKPLRKAGVKLADLLFHFTYTTEFLWTVVEPSEQGRTISILDLEGVGLWDFAGDVIDFVKKSIALSGEHYPERAYRIFIVNAPRFFTTIWAVVKPLLDDATRKKVGLFRGSFKDALLEDIDIEVLPEKYGGLNKTPMGEFEADRLLQSIVCKTLIEKGVKMLDDDGKPCDKDLERYVDDSIERGVSKLDLAAVAESKVVGKSKK